MNHNNTTAIVGRKEEACTIHSEFYKSIIIQLLFDSDSIEWFPTINTNTIIAKHNYYTNNCN
jgi:hypothetical protein